MLLYDVDVGVYRFATYYKLYAEKDTKKPIFNKMGSRITSKMRDL